MSELGRAMRALSNLPLVLHKNPKGTWSYVGSGPRELFYEGPADAIEIGIKHGIGLVRHRGVKVRTWETKDEAIKAAEAIGANVGQVVGE